MVSSLRWVGFRSSLVFLCCVFTHNYETRADNSYVREKCSNFICNPPEETHDCFEISHPSKLDEVEFQFEPKDQCCPVYQCYNGYGDQYFGIFGGYKKRSHRIGRAADVCEGVLCKPKPTLGKCTQRDATTVAATAVYGPTRKCCPMWACSHPNGTTTMHYTGPTDIKVPKKGEKKKVVDPNAVFNETCSGVYCMEGQPSKNCRKNTPDEMKNLMKVDVDCCPIWTCSFSNGSMYYIHPGMQQKSKFWKVTDKDAEDPVTEPPPLVDENNSTTPAPEVNDLEVDISRGVKVPSLKKTPSVQCPRVSCTPPQDGLQCSVLEKPDSKKLKLLGLGSECCPLYKCSGKNKAFVVQFGMFVTELPSNDTEDQSASSMRPPTITTVAPDPPTTLTATTMASAGANVTPKPKGDIKTTTKATARAMTKPKTTVSIQSTTIASPEQDSAVVTTASPPIRSTTVSNHKAPDKAKPKASLTSTTVAPPDDAKVTTETPAQATTVSNVKAIGKTKPKTIIKSTTMTSVEAKSTKKKAILKSTTMANAGTDSVDPTESPIVATTVANPKTTGKAKPKVDIKSTTMPSVAAGAKSKLKANHKSTTTPSAGADAEVPTEKPVSATPVATPGARGKGRAGPDIRTTTEPNPELVVDGEEIDDLSSMMANSTVNKPQCKNVQCFPSPSNETCTVAPSLTDCDLVKLLGSAVECCPSYKCKSDKGDVIQFGMTDGISETVVSSPVPKGAGATSACGNNESTVATNQTTADKEKHFEIHAILSEPTPVKLRPVMIFEMPKESATKAKLVRYVKTCKGVSCSPPSGLDIKFCQKLPKGTVPKQMQALGVTDACCFVWKCVQTDNRTSTHYGVSQKPVLHIPFEYKGSDTGKLPKSITVKDPEAASAKSKCPDIICSPPLQNAECKVADPSTVKLVKLSLGPNKKCCPIWACKRKDGSILIIYGRTSPKGYKTSNFRSILQGKSYVSPAPATEELPVKVFAIEHRQNDPKKKKTILKPNLKSSMKFKKPKQPTPTTMSPETEPDESQGETTPAADTTTEKAEPVPKGRILKAAKSKAKSKAKKEPTEDEIQKQQMQQDQEQLAAMQQNDMDNIKRLEDNNRQAMMGLNQPQTMPEEETGAGENGDDVPGGGDGSEIPAGEGDDSGTGPVVYAGGSSSNMMVQRMEMNGMVMESSMPNSGPPLPAQSMQMPGMTMNQYG